MSTIADSQPHLEVASSQPLFSQQDDSQNTQSSAGLSQCNQLFDYVLDEKATPEGFEGLHSQSQGTPCSANSLFASQRSLQKCSANPTDKDSQSRALGVFMGYPVEDAGSQKLNRVSQKTIPDSQKTNYCSNEATKEATKEASLFITPITSQEDNDDSKTPTVSQNQPSVHVQTVVERMENLAEGQDDDDTEVEDNQPMESDEIESDEMDKVSASDNDQENRAIVNVCMSKGAIPNALNAAAFGPTGKQDLAFGPKLISAGFRKQPSQSIFDQANTSKAKQLYQFNGKQMMNGHFSIGKTNEMITKLEMITRQGACHEDYSQIGLPNCGGPAVLPVKSIGKSENNFGKQIDPRQDNQQPAAYGNQQPMEIQYATDEPAHGPPAFGAYDNQNHAGKFLPNYYPGKQQQFYGKQQPPGCKQMYQHSSKAMTNHETSPNYTLTDLDDCQARPSYGKSISSGYRTSASSDCYYGCASNLSRSSSPVNVNDETFNEDSNDSLRKKRKNPLDLQGDEHHSEQLAKVTKMINDDRQKNSALQEVKSLSQQLESASIENSFDFFQQTSDYYSGNSSVKPDWIDNSQQNCLSNLDRSIETPRKSAAPYGPIQKPASKTNKKSRGKKKSDETELIKRAPVQKRLNITECQKEPAKQSDPRSGRRASTVKEAAVNVRPSRSASTRSARSRVSSVCSSLASEDDDDAEEKGLSRKDVRRIKNNKSAKEYRARQKVKEEQLNADMSELEKKHNELKRELRKVLVKKHVYVKDAIETGAIKLPEWTKKIKNPEDHFLSG